MDQQSDRPCGKTSLVICIQKGCAITFSNQRQSIEEAGVNFGTEGALYIPWVIISTGEEVNRANSKGRDVDWASISSDDSRIHSNQWYTAGRSTPPPGESIYRRRG